MGIGRELLWERCDTEVSVGYAFRWVLGIKGVVFGVWGGG